MSSLLVEQCLQIDKEAKLTFNDLCWILWGSRWCPSNPLNWSTSIYLDLKVKVCSPSVFWHQDNLCYCYKLFTKKLQLRYLWMVNVSIHLDLVVCKRATLRYFHGINVDSKYEVFFSYIFVASFIFDITWCQR